MDKQLTDQIIEILKQGKDIPVEYQDVLFPVNHKEYELTYKNKMPKEQVLAIGEEPQSVPFQIEKTFGRKSADDWRNLLIFGDNFQVLKTIFDNKDELIKNKIKGKVKLIYIDPPFATQNDFSGKEGAKAYSDKIKGAEFIEFLRQRLILAKEVLSDDGTIYLHLDTKMVHYIKVIMDEIFGKNNFQNEIIWCYNEAINSKKRWNRKHDVILFYSKTENFTFNYNEVLDNYSDNTKNKYKHKDENGNYYRLMGRGLANSPIKSKRDVSIEWETTNPELVYRHYLKEGVLPVDYWNIPIINQSSKERLGYPTQKPEELLEKIILASSNEDDIVMDFFAGSGTTLAVAERFNRRWIGVDIGKLAIYTIHKRLLTLPHCKPFALVNAGCYDLKKVFEMERTKYVDFVCELFHIEKTTGKKLAGVPMDGKRRGDWVKIYEWQDFKNNTAVDENFINELHGTIGEKVGEKFYIVAPELNFDIVGDYYKPVGSNTKYFFLKIPYQYIKDLHKIEFKKLNQPKTKNGINSIENSVGFYFNEIPQVESRVESLGNKIVLHIDKCVSETVVTDKENILAMVLIDSTDSKDFIMQEYYFADEIKDKITGTHNIEIDKKDLKSNKLKVVYIDIFGNEFTEVLEVSK